MSILQHNWQKTGQLTKKSWGRGWVVLVVSTKWQDISLTSWGSNLRKQPIFRDVTNGLPAKWHPRNEHRNFKLVMRQALKPDLGNDVSSVWNFCANCFSDVISWGSRWWHRKMNVTLVSSEGLRISRGCPPPRPINRPRWITPSLISKILQMIL